MIVKEFEQIFALRHRVEIYIPGTMHNTPAPDAQQHFAGTAARAFSQMFGGCTTTDAAGVWYSQELGKNISEDIVIVFSYCDGAQIQQHAAAVIDLAKRIKAEMAQESVTVVYDSNCMFI